MVNKIRHTIGEVFTEVADALITGSFGKKTKVGLTILGSEHGPAELLYGAELAQAANPDIQVVVIGNEVSTDLEMVAAENEEEAHAQMDEMLLTGDLDTAVTMHYSFPIGVSTVGRVVTPARGKPMFLATTTGISDVERVAAMLKNTIYGIAAAKACGITNPTLGILNVEGGRQLERALRKLYKNGYKINFTESARGDGGVVMRGNDLLMGVPDVMVNDSLSGNVLMKMFSAYNTGGNYESTGYGYGPGIGENYDRIICIISRASGAPVVAGAIRLAADCARGDLINKVKTEFATVRKAGWDQAIGALKAPGPVADKSNNKAEVTAPPQKLATYALPGVDVMDIEEAVLSLWKENIYAESGMGCTGPIIMLAPEDREQALKILKDNNYL